MLLFRNHADAEGDRLPASAAQAVLHELDTLLTLSEGETVDPEYGYVCLWEATDTPQALEEILSRPVEGASRRFDCVTLYLGGGGNEHLTAVVLPEELLSENQRHAVSKHLSRGEEL